MGRGLSLVARVLQRLILRLSILHATLGCIFSELGLKFLTIISF